MAAVDLQVEEAVEEAVEAGNSCYNKRYYGYFIYRAVNKCR